MEKRRVLTHYDEEHDVTDIFLGSASGATYVENIGSGVHIRRDIRTNEIKSIRIIHRSN
jgi:hypothetical protein